MQLIGLFLRQKRVASRYARYGEGEAVVEREFFATDGEVSICSTCKHSSEARAGSMKKVADRSPQRTVTDWSVSDSIFLAEIIFCRMSERYISSDIMPLMWAI